jgi:uncharacterized phosphosugar-binding protein
MLSLKWLENTRALLDEIENTQLPNIDKAAEMMADSIGAEHWVHTFGCGHSTIPVEEMYPRIGGFVGFHPMIELPLSFFTHIKGEMGIHQFLFLERAEGYGKEIMKNYNFHPDDSMWLFSHSGINNVNIDVALETKKIGMNLIVCGSERAFEGTETRHSSGKNLFELADVVVDSCVPAIDASVELVHHFDKVGPLSTLAFTTLVWMIITRTAELLEERGTQLYIHPSHNVPGDDTAQERLSKALDEYKRRMADL